MVGRGGSAHHRPSPQLPELGHPSSPGEGRLSFEGLLVRLPQKEPTFLAIRWESGQEKEGEVATPEATLCKLHRQEIAQEFPNAQGHEQAVDEE